METAVGKLLLKGVCSASNYDRRAINSILISFAYFLCLFTMPWQIKNKVLARIRFCTLKRGEIERLIFFLKKGEFVSDRPDGKDIIKSYCVG